MAATIVSYATFLEIRTRRQRIVAELASAEGQVVGAPAGSAPTIAAESLKPSSNFTKTTARCVLPVDL
jgi:hypothetical protein